jgi:NAD+ synthase
MFDAEKVKNDIVKWIREWFENNGPGCNGVVAVSGGKDSSVVAALLVEALGKDRVIGVMLPRGVQPDIDMSYLLVKHLGIKSYEINVGETIDALEREMRNVMGEDAVSTQAIVNLPPRVRMAATYAVSQSVNGRVANTCNLSEDWVGYATRYGDNAGDFSPLSRLTVQEVKAVGRVLGLPDVLVDKVPSDGLQAKTDEDNLGFTYAVLDRYIREGVIDDPETKKRIDHLHKINAFKLKYMDCFEYVPE